ncbi:DUF6958 family protein [Engelhardtia mirabilis]|uniref:Uncharacterized protein n=1 Tax=Engelhardtia mirabilis TaxID=2528011 RepID=A0A518BFD6_9BACT|nr:hypothetical protein Pla133_07600 [Planctomycetes bacterium Pla133]QDV00021.1 hypothetical protein Pla86_07590 [Planctomycetes bacterium Pla86]
MKTDDRILTLHPAGKQGVNIERSKYDLVRTALLRVVPRSADGVAFKELRTLVGPQLEAAGFPREASVSWYVTVVKQDLEARGEVVQVTDARPQRLRRPTRGR